MKRTFLLTFLLCLFGKLLVAQDDFNADGGCSPGVYALGPTYLNPNLIQSTFRFSMFSQDGTRLAGCTGCLVNQWVNGRPRQLFLTARHCIREGQYGEGQDRRFNDVRFVFNFQSNNGTQDAIPLRQAPLLGNRGNFPEFRYSFTSRVERRYESTALLTEIGFGYGVDIALMEIMEPIPPHFNVFYAGWTPSLLTGFGGVSDAPMRLVQHPAGDAKKFSETLSIRTNDTPLATNCRIITRVIDGVFNFFGIKTITEIACSWTDIPQYVVPLLTKGATRRGASGSPFFTRDSRLFAVYSSSPFGQCANVGTTYGKFRNAYGSREMRDHLNPNYDVWVNQFGIDGKAIGCYNDNPLRLSGNYFPVGDYQPINQQFISAERVIQAGAVAGSTNAAARFAVGGGLLPPVGNGLEEGFLRIYNGADFVFSAGEAVLLVDGFEAQAGSRFTARIQGCNPNARLSAPDNDRPAPVLPPVQEMPDDEDQLLITPNPATGEVRCRYTLTQPGAVQISVVNMSGQAVQTLFEATAQPVGSYDVPGNVSALPAGSYLVQLQTGSVKTAARLVVVK
jgi:hypothetical protein